MNNIIDVLTKSVYFGVFITLFSFVLGSWLKNKFKLAIFNPILVSVVFCILALLLLKLDYTVYYEGARYINFLLTPATVCLAIPLYEKFELLKENLWAVLFGIIAGCIASLSSILGIAIIFKMSHTEFVTLLPKSITTAIGMGVSKELGGYVAITVAIIILTGILGNMIGERVLKAFKIKNPIAKGVALGTSAHAMGTTKAMEIGEIEGAMSSVSLVVSGLLTVIGATVFSYFI